MKDLLAIILILLPIMAWGEDGHDITLDAEKSGVCYYLDSSIKFNESKFERIGLGIVAEYNRELGFFLYNEGRADEEIETPAGMIAVIALKNGEILTIRSIDNGDHWTTPRKVPMLSSNLNDTWYHYRISYPITSEEADLIRQFGVDKIRLAKGSVLYDTTLTEEDNAFMIESVDKLRIRISENQGLYDDFLPPAQQSRALLSI